MQNSLFHSLIQFLNGCFIRSLRLGGIAAGESCVKLLEGGLQIRLLSLILFIGLSGIAILFILFFSKREKNDNR